jgi:hypothetical protein
MALFCYGSNRRHGPSHARKKRRLAIAFALQKIAKDSITVVLHCRLSRGQKLRRCLPSAVCLGAANSPAPPCWGSSTAGAGSSWVGGTWGVPSALWRGLERELPRHWCVNRACRDPRGQSRAARAPPPPAPRAPRRPRQAQQQMRLWLWAVGCG